MEPQKIILLPLDGSDSSLKALIPAKSLSKTLNLTIEILYVSDEELPKSELINKLNLCRDDISECMINQKTGSVLENILKEAKRAEYIVMGTHGETHDMSKIAGSISSTVIQESDTPVLLIRPDLQIAIEDGLWRPQKALIPLNGTPGAAQALAPAIELLSKSELEVDILHIPTVKSKVPDEEGSLTMSYYADSPQHEWKNWSHEFLKRFCPVLDRNHIKYKLYVANGEPADEIIKFEKEHNNDLIAMAWHGKLGHLKASILKKVIFGVQCPVLLIKIK